jgi:hypothetical protein
MRKYIQKVKTLTSLPGFRMFFLGGGGDKDNSFSSSDGRSEVKVVNEEGRNLISFCETLNLETLNGNRRGVLPSKMTSTPKRGSAVVD